MECEAGNWKLETVNRKPETGNRKPETGNRKPETGNRKPETENRKPETGNLNFKFQTYFLLILAMFFICSGCASNVSSVQKTDDSARGGVAETVLPKVITEITTTETTEATNVLIKGNRVLTYTSVKQPSPLAIILYFSETGLELGNWKPDSESDIRSESPAGDYQLPVFDNDIISSVKASETADTGNGHTSKVDILLKKDAPYEVAREDTGVKISFTRGPSSVVGGPSSVVGGPSPVVGGPSPVVGGPSSVVGDSSPLVGGRWSVATEDRGVGAVDSGQWTDDGGQWTDDSPPLEVWNPKIKAWVPESQAMESEVRSQRSAPVSDYRFPPATHVQSVYATRLEGGLKVFVGADGAITNYKAFTIGSPARIVFDIFNVKSPYKKEKWVPVGSKWVKQVRYYAYPDRLRVVLDTEKAYLSAFTANPVEDGLEIRVGSTVRYDSQLPAVIYPSATHLHSVYATQVENGVKITVRGDGSITNYKSYASDTPPRIIFDIFNVISSDEKEKSFPVDAKWVKRVQYKVIRSPRGSDYDSLRVIIDTQKAYLSAFSAFPDKDGLVIRVGSVVSGPSSVVSGPSSVVSGLADSGPPATVDLIVFVPEAAGKSSLILEMSGPVTYDIIKTADKKLELKLFNSRIPDYRYRQGALITTHFESAVDRIIPLRRAGMGNTSLFEIDLREAVPYFVEQTEDSGKHHLMVHFEASSIPPKSLAQARKPSADITVTDMGDTELEVTGPETEPEAQVPETAPSVPEQQYPPPEQQLPPAGQQYPPPVGQQPPGPVADTDDEFSVPEAPKRYTGEKIALDFFETDIKNVFRILREVSGKNFAIDKDVSGKVTLTLEHPVPWDQVLDLILKMNKLGKTYEGDIIRIATQKTLQAEEADREKRKQDERDRLEAKKKLDPLFTEYIAINYSNAKKEIMPHINQILTKERGTVSVDDRTNMVILTDTAEKIRQAKEIVEKLDRVTPQVLIEARIVEASANFSRDIGTNWGATGGIQNDDANAGVGPQRGYDMFGGTYGYEMAMNLPAAIENKATIGFNFLRIAGSPLALHAKLTAMETMGEAKVISAPKIVTLDNKKATIKQGFSYPYQTVEDGNVKTAFKEVDLVLEVVPHVTPDNRISMTINITKNDLGQVIGGRQSFNTKETKTELLVNDGDTVVIGGIIKTAERNSNSGIPGLSNIPLIGWLFKSKSNKEEKEELLIFITPTIIQLEQRRTQY
ncbi:type IV pilus secretin PilQ [Desulfobacterales bacterium HSG2]|nr:type IV pilus secretin PilQ [Desulfobacterales bacterium HSG2]